MTKLVSAAEAIARIPDNATLASAGWKIVFCKAEARPA
jgi:acyl CoA:acetate/3-ketoacid CoA transferase